MAYIVVKAQRQQAFLPFTPKIVELGYVTPPAAPSVQLNLSCTGDDDCCPINYPYDPRNLSQRGIYHSAQATATAVCATDPSITSTATVPVGWFWSTVSQADADALAEAAAIAKADWNLAERGCGDFLVTFNDQYIVTFNNALISSFIT